MNLKKPILKRSKLKKKKKKILHIRFLHIVGFIENKIMMSKYKCAITF